MLSLKAYCRAGCVTLLLGMFGWWTFHFLWLTSPDVNIEWFAIVMILTLFSTTFYQNTFVYQNYNVVGWMFMPAGLFGWYTGDWGLAAIVWLGASFGSMTVVFLAFLLSVAYSFQIQSFLPIITVIPGTMKLLFHFIPPIVNGNIKEAILETAKAIGFFGTSKAKYKRSGITLNSFVTKSLKSILIYLQFIIIYYYITSEIPILFSVAIFIWVVNSTSFRFADEESMKILLLTVAVSTLCLINDYNLILLISYWFLVSPFFERSLILSPFNVSPILDEIEIFLNPVEKEKRIIIAFNDPNGDYNKIFDGQRFLLDFPMYVATRKNIHLMPDFSSVFEANFNDAPNLWGTSVSDIKKQIKDWDADYCIIYQLNMTMLESKWEKEGFINVSHLSWKCLAAKQNYNLPGGLYPDWFLLKATNL